MLRAAEGPLAEEEVPEERVLEERVLEEALLLRVEVAALAEGRVLEFEPAAVQEAATRSRPNSTPGSTVARPIGATLARIEHKVPTGLQATVRVPAELAAWKEVSHRRKRARSSLNFPNLRA